MGNRRAALGAALVAGLFAGAGVAFAVGVYALGAWLATGCAGLSAVLLRERTLADHPATVTALDALNARLDAMDAAHEAHRTDLQGKLGFLVTSVSAAFPQRLAQTTRSGIVPPAGARRGMP